MDLLSITFLAVFTEGLITYLAGDSEKNVTRPYLKYVSLVLGIALAVVYQANIFEVVGLDLGAIDPIVDYVVTGLVIGRGSNYLNDIVSRVKGNRGAVSQPLRGVRTEPRG